MEGKVSVVIPACASVYMKVRRPYEPIRLSLQEDLYSYGIMLMVEEGDVVTDEVNRGLIECAIQGDGAVFSHPASCPFPEIIFQILWSLTDAVHMIGETFKRALPGTCVFSTVADVPDPALQGFIEIEEAGPFETGEELGSHGSEQSLDFSPSLGFIGPGMDKGYAEGGG